MIIRSSASPVYKFLATINSRIETKLFKNMKVLDCGAGGDLPPLSIFASNGFESVGIDISRNQVDKANEFAKRNRLDMKFIEGDMRDLPFDDESFDYVYEHFSIGHLSHTDTAKTLKEIYRVLKKGGLCQIGLISTNSRPSKLMGTDQGNGKYVNKASDGDRVHYLFTDIEMDNLVSDWKIISKENSGVYLLDYAKNISMDEWLKFYDESSNISLEDWKKRYDDRANELEYVHTYFILEK